MPIQYALALYPITGFFFSPLVMPHNLWDLISLIRDVAKAFLLQPSTPLICRQCKFRGKVFEIVTHHSFIYVKTILDAKFFYKNNCK